VVAVAFIAANPGTVGLVTVSIGGNDVTRCASALGRQGSNAAPAPHSTPRVPIVHGGAAEPRGEELHLAGIVPPDDVAGAAACIQDVQDPAGTVAPAAPTPGNHDPIPNSCWHGGPPPRPLTIAMVNLHSVVFKS
jgi:hypothetical protein